MRRDKEQYQFLGALGAAAEGPEEEDGDGAGEEDTSCDLKRGRVVILGENGGLGGKDLDRTFVDRGFI